MCCAECCRDPCRKSVVANYNRLPTRPEASPTPAEAFCQPLIIFVILNSRQIDGASGRCAQCLHEQPMSQM